MGKDTLCPSNKGEYDDCFLDYFLEYDVSGLIHDEQIKLTFAFVSEYSRVQGVDKSYRWIGDADSIPPA